jgi:hypothetical protein
MRNDYICVLGISASPEEFARRVAESEVEAENATFLETEAPSTGNWTWCLLEIIDPCDLIELCGYLVSAFFSLLH